MAGFLSNTDEKVAPIKLLLSKIGQLPCIEATVDLDFWDSATADALEARARTDCDHRSSTAEVAADWVS